MCGGHLTEVQSSQTREKLLATIILHLLVLLFMEIQLHEVTITGKRVKSSTTFCERPSYSLSISWYNSSFADSFLIRNSSIA